MPKQSEEVVHLRRTKLMHYIQEQGRASIAELAARFQVSALTIRRDLQYWEEFHAIERFHGGARLIQVILSDEQNTDSFEKDRKTIAQHAIARRAAQYVQEGETIFINTSRTALRTLEYIHDKRINVITNNARVLKMELDPKISIFLTGGSVQFPKQGLTGDFTLMNLQRINADRTLLGCSGISAKNGITTGIFEEAAVNEMMILRCQGEVLLLADHTKIDNDYSFCSGTLNQVDRLITDSHASEAQVASLEQCGIEVIFAA